MDQPIGYIGQNLMSYNNLQPSVVKGRCNPSTEFWKRQLYNKLYSKFEFTLPKAWALNYFRTLLFKCGSVAVIYTSEYGWATQAYGIEKLDMYYNPAVITVFNQFFKTDKRGIIGVNAEIIKCFDDYYGFDDLVTRYAEKLAQIDKSIDINLMNCNVSAFFQAESKKSADIVKEAYGRATAGEPFIAINKDVMDGEEIKPLLSQVKNTYIVGDLLQARRTILNQYLTEIGIKNANYDKRERLNADEVNQNNEETESIISVVNRNITECINRVNEISDLGISVTLKDGDSDEH